MGTGSDSVLLKIPASLLAQVRAAAEEQQRAPNEIVREALERYLESRHPSNAQITDAAERAHAFELWARSHPYTPPLPDEAIQRENLVRDPR